MNWQIRNRHLLIADIILLILSTYVSFVLRLENLDLDYYWPGFILFSVSVLLVVPLLFYRSGLYARYWRYISLEELLLLSGSIAIATALIDGVNIAVNWMLFDIAVIPRSIPAIFLLLAIPATIVPRLAVRLSFGYSFRYRYRGSSIPVLVIGAGDAGEMLVRDMRKHSQHGRKVVGFIDDNPLKQRIRIHSIPVLGDRHSIPEIVQTYNIQQIIIAIPSASGKVIREMVSICERTGVQTKIIPGIPELLDGKVSVNQLRDVQIEDLLRRKPVQTDISAVSELIRGRRVLITGGGGSIGSELCRQVLRCRPAELVVLGHGENSVFTIQNELQKNIAMLRESSFMDGFDVGEYVLPRIEAVIADIRFPERLHNVFEEYQPEIVFHAAAHKHVPLMELNPAEAIMNNILGTRNLLEAALTIGVERFVMISTDKAVNPTSVMGASKRMAELLVHQAAKLSGRPFMAVRFGNVLGSRGSVVLTFKQQIASGGPVTVTDPEMRRFFMTIPEAVQLVLQAAVLGHGGEAFSLDMGEPVKIVDLARDMIELSGLEVGRDIDIHFTGVRPGEKLYEELFVAGEEYRRTVHEKIFIASNASSFVPLDLNEAVNALVDAAQQNNRAEIIYLLQALIPQFRPSRENTATIRTVEHLHAKSVGS